MIFCNFLLACLASAFNCADGTKPKKSLPQRPEDTSIERELPLPRCDVVLSRGRTGGGEHFGLRELRGDSGMLTGLLINATAKVRHTICYGFVKAAPQKALADLYIKSCVLLREEVY